MQIPGLPQTGWLRYSGGGVYQALHVVLIQAPVWEHCPRETARHISPINFAVVISDNGCCIFINFFSLIFETTSFSNIFSSFSYYHFSLNYYCPFTALQLFCLTTRIFNLLSLLYWHKPQFSLTPHSVSDSTLMLLSLFPSHLGSSLVELQNCSTLRHCSSVVPRIAGFL